MVKRSLATDLAGVLLGLCTCICPAAAAPLTAEGAARVVAHVAGQSFTWDRHYAARAGGRPAIRLRGRWASASVDQETGCLVSFHWSARSREERPAGLPVTAAEARTASAAALVRAGVQLFPLWRVTKEEWIEHTPGRPDFEFEWRKVLHGVELPGMGQVAIDALTGKLSIFILMDGPVVVPIEARLTQDEAARMVAQQARVAHYRLEEAVLRVGTLGTGPQSVYWKVRIVQTGSTQPLGHPQEYLGFVDANSGKVRALMASAGMAQPGKQARPEPRRPGLRTYRPPRLNLAAARRARIPPTVFELAKARQRAAAAARATRNRTGR